jgi:hypothetical protein
MVPALFLHLSPRFESEYKVFRHESADTEKPEPEIRRAITVQVTLENAVVSAIREA